MCLLLQIKFIWSFVSGCTQFAIKLTCLTTQSWHHGINSLYVSSTSDAQLLLMVINFVHWILWWQLGVLFKHGLFFLRNLIAWVQHHFRLNANIKYFQQLTIQVIFIYGQYILFLQKLSIILIDQSVNILYFLHKIHLSMILFSNRRKLIFNFTSLIIADKV